MARLFDGYGDYVHLTKEEIEAMNVVYEELPGRRTITVTALAGEYRLAPRVEYRRAGSCGTIDPLALVESWTITFTKMEEGHGRDADNQITPGTV